jgi:pimeloyl-ACP methyl ester carboxylesterase
MFIATTLLVAQIVLSRCTVEGVPGPAHCGTYRVWENRELKQGRQIPLSLIVLDALNPGRKPDPLVFLQGGPGDAPSFNARFYSNVFANVRQTHDLVLIDLRGTGKSAALTCPELAQPDQSGVLSADLLDVKALRACRQRLEQNADLRFYTTEIAVDDLDEVRQALGYRQINIYGTSYGTRVAQVYMRRHPAALRTVSLKGVVPPSLAFPESHARAGEEAWGQLVQRCLNDVDCARNYPTLDQDFRRLLKRLEESPPLLSIPPGNNSVASKVKVTRGLFAEAFRNVLYSPEASARAPSLVKTISNGDEQTIAATTLGTRLLVSGGRLAAGFFLSVSCTEDVPYLPKDIALLTAGTFGGDYRLRQQMAACAVWPKGEVSPQHRQQTKSAIPTLLLSGEFDPVTPPTGGEEVLRGLSHGLHVVVRNNGHPIGSAQQCIGAMIGALIDKGSVEGLDHSCAATIPPVPFAVAPR